MEIEFVNSWKDQEAVYLLPLIAVQRIGNATSIAVGWLVFAVVIEW